MGAIRIKWSYFDANKNKQLFWRQYRKKNMGAANGKLSYYDVNQNDTESWLKKQLQFDKWSVCANVKKKKFLEELHERSQILPKLEKFLLLFLILLKVKSSKKVEKNFGQIRYLIDLMNDFCCCKAYLWWGGSEADVELFTSLFCWYKNTSIIMIIIIRMMMMMMMGDDDDR